MPVREIIAAICIIMGLLVFLCATFGVFRLKYVMNKIFHKHITHTYTYHTYYLKISFKIHTSCIFKVLFITGKPNL